MKKPERDAFVGFYDNGTYRVGCSGTTVYVFDRDGNEFEFTGEDLYARCICHECDHLDGVLYVEKAEKMFDLETEE